MIARIVEFTNGFLSTSQSWKFMVAQFDDQEWDQKSALPEASPYTSLLAQIGHDRYHLWVLDLQTCEGACFRPGGNAHADLEKHAIWVCPMYEIFLGWLYRHPEFWQSVQSLPPLIVDKGQEALAASGWAGHRRPGPQAKKDCP
jgi:hypothetical protein